jgi:hypothetical protein
MNVTLVLSNIASFSSKKYPNNKKNILVGIEYMINCWPIKTIASLVKVGRGFLHSTFPSYSSRQCSILTPPTVLSLGWRLDGV